MDDLKTLTLRELSAALNLTIEAARARAKRRDKSGHWKILKGNHPSDPMRVQLPAADLDVTPAQKPVYVKLDAPRVDQTDTSQREEVDAHIIATFRELLNDKEKQIVELSGRLLQSETVLADLKARAELTESALRAQVDDLIDVIDQLRNRSLLNRILKR